MLSNISDIAREIAKTLGDYTDEIKKEISKAQDDLSKEGLQLLKSSSPKDTGKYAKSWTRKKTKTGYVIHNKRYQLTHLLEKGYVKRGGGRVAARVHIAPVEQRLINEFEERIERAIRS